MIAILCLFVLAVAAAKAAGVEAAAHAHNVLVGFLAAGLVLLTTAPLARWFVSAGRRLPRNRVRRMRIRLRLGLRPDRV